MFKGKGIPASELRPFSVEDPEGTGRLGPSAAELRVRELRARFERRRPSTEHQHRSSNDEHEHVTEQQGSGQSLTRRNKHSSSPDTGPAFRDTASAFRRPSPEPAGEVRPRQRLSLHPKGTAKPTTQRRERSGKKRAGCGCLGCFPVLLLLGAFLFTAVPYAVDFAKQHLGQQLLRHTGLEAPAQILAVERMPFSFNDQVLYELTLAVHLSDGRLARATVKQLFVQDATSHLTPGSWVQVRIDPNEPSSLVITSVGHARPGSLPRRPTQRL